MSVQIARRCFNVSEYDRMAEAGILSEDDRVELIEGEIVEMSPIGSRHSACVNRLNALFSSLARQTAIISVQNPIRLDDYSEPEPDIALLRKRDDFYAGAHPAPADVLLLIEVADTSVEYDRNVKVPLYARAGIVEVWLIDLAADVVEIYAQPVSGKYQTFRRAGRGETIVSQAADSVSLGVDAVLG